jgi:hypothetical protein
MAFMVPEMVLTTQFRPSKMASTVPETVLVAVVN